MAFITLQVVHGKHPYCLSVCFPASCSVSYGHLHTISLTATVASLHPSNLVILIVIIDQRVDLRVHRKVVVRLRALWSVALGNQDDRHILIFNNAHKLALQIHQS